MIDILGFARGSGWADLDGPQYYRCYLPLREVNRNAEGIKANIISRDAISGMTDDELGDRDIYVMARMYHGKCDKFIAEIHRRGGVLVLDSDDDLTETYRLVSGRGREFREVLGKVDYATCSTQALADHLGQYTKRQPVVLRNHIDTEWMAGVAGEAKRAIEGLTIGFSGLLTHWGDWYVAAVPFARIVQDFDVTPVAHGEIPAYLEHVDRLVKLDRVPFSIYPALLSQFDIVLCAVDSDDKFNSGKSAVKALESMAVGAVPICSKFGPYCELRDAGAPVFIVEENSPDAWYEAMAKMIKYPDCRKTMSNDGPKWVRENRDMCHTGYKAWQNFYKGIAL